MKKKITTLENLFKEDEDSLAALAARAGIKLDKTKKPGKQKKPNPLAAAPAAPVPPMSKADQDSLAGLAHKAKAGLGKPAAPPDDLPKPLKAPPIPEPTPEPAKASPRVTSGSVQHPSGPFKAWEHHSDRMDKDFPDAHDEFHDFINHVQDTHAQTDYKRLTNSNHSNGVYHGRIIVPGKGQEGFFAKPHHKIRDYFGDTQEYKDILGKRQEGTYRLGSMMGMSHMVIPGKNIILPGKAHSNMKYGDEDEILGKPAMVTKAIDADPIARHSRMALASQLDPEEVQNSAVFHALTGHRDAHSGNVLIRHDSKGKPHPVSMDWDLAMHPHENQEEWGDPEERKNYLRSVFMPNKEYDYQKIAGQVGKNYSPRTQATLNWIANGGHTDKEHGLGLDPKDAEHLGRNAHDLLNHGLENMLKKRKISPY
jgi:hypothetical protein